MNILMVSKSEYRTDIRVRREAEALVGAGHEVQVITTDTRQMEVKGVLVRGTAAPSGLGSSRRRDAKLFRAVRWMLLPEHRQRAIRQFQSRVLAEAGRLEVLPDIVHAHDFPALGPSARVAERHSAKLVYDSHEFWSGLPRYGRPEPIRRHRQLAEESRLAKQADRVITVSEGAAAAIADALDLESITIVRNTFPADDSFPVVDKPTGAVYAGRIGSGRDLDTVFASPGWGRTRSLHLMGPKENGFSIPDFAIRHEPDSMEAVNRLLSNVGVSLIPLAKGPPNHDVALPNKLFQSISAGIPVVAADLREIRRVVEESGAGELYTPGDPHSFAAALDIVVDDYSAIRQQILGARATYDWSIDAGRLTEMYESLV